MRDHDATLRRLLLLPSGSHDESAAWADETPPDRSRRHADAVARAAALIASGAAESSYRRCVHDLIACGGAPDDLIDALRAVAPTVGLARLVVAAPSVASALGYDIDAQIEESPYRRPIPER